MALNIRNLETQRLAEALAKPTGETKTQAVTKPIRERLVLLERERACPSLADELGRIATHCASLPVLDERTDDEILGYDEGLPG